jgi:hypothetical protein
MIASIPSPALRRPVALKRRKPAIPLLSSLIAPEKSRLRCAIVWRTPVKAVALTHGARRKLLSCKRIPPFRGIRIRFCNISRVALFLVRIGRARRVPEGRGDTPLKTDVRMLRKPPRQKAERKRSLRGEEGGGKYREFRKITIKPLWKSPKPYPMLDRPPRHATVSLFAIRYSLFAIRRPPPLTAPAPQSADWRSPACRS